MHDAILTAMDNVVFSRVEMAARSITGSSGKGPSRVVQNPDRRVFKGNTEKTPLGSASSQLDLNVDQDRNAETRNVVNFECVDFPVLGSIDDQPAHAHHICGIYQRSLEYIIHESFGEIASNKKSRT